MWKIPEQYKYTITRDGERFENSVFVFSDRPDTAWTHPVGDFKSDTSLMIGGFISKGAADSFIRQRLEEFRPAAERTCEHRGERIGSEVIHTGDTFHWNYYPVCPQCGAQYVSTFSRFMMHP